MAALAVAVGYGLGSLAFAVLVSRAMHLADPRNYGSKNPECDQHVALGQQARGCAYPAAGRSKALWRCGWRRLRVGCTRQHRLYAVGLAAFVGHCTRYFWLSRGKGVATAAGVLLALQPVLGLATLATFGLICSFSLRVVGVDGGCGVCPVLLVVWQRGVVADAAHGVVALAVMAGLLVWRHQTNISRLLAGTEGKLGNPDRQSPTKSR